MIGDRDGNGGAGNLLLHDDMATALADLRETVFDQNGADLFAGEDAPFTQRQPPLG